MKLTTMILGLVQLMIGCALIGFVLQSWMAGTALWCILSAFYLK